MTRVEYIKRLARGAGWLYVAKVALFGPPIFVWVTVGKALEAVGTWMVKTGERL